MPLKNVAPIEVAIEIAAPPAVVWGLVSDLTNMPRWSPQCRKVFVLGSSTGSKGSKRGPLGKGTKMLNINRRGLLFWPTQSMVTEVVPEQRIAFRVKENWTIWSFELSPTADGGTRVVQRREAPKGISDVSVGLTKTVLGGVDNFVAELEQGMRQTLGRIKDEAEQQAGPRAA